MAHASGNAAHIGESALDVLQVKYEAVLAENEGLMHELRAERLRRRRAEAAYTHIQSDVQRNESALQELLATVTPNPAAASSGTARVDKLERECSYLQSKVESLHFALQRYEEGSEAELERTDPADFVTGGARRGARARASGGASARRATACEAALEAERAARSRAEAHFARCHAALDALRDDTRKKDAAFYQQLAALQEQNAALLEDLDTWVTTAQQPHLARALPAQHVVPTPRVAESQAVAAAEARLHSLHRHMEDQEAVIAAKERSIAQLEGRVRELTAAQALPSATAVECSLDVAELAKVHGEAASLLAFLASCAALLEVRGIYVPAAPAGGAPTSSTASMLTETRAALRTALEVLRVTLVPAQPPVLRSRWKAPAAGDTYRSGETLSDAARELAALMRGHAAAAADDAPQR